MNHYSLTATSIKQNWGAARIAGLYLLLGCLWILFSDQLAAVIAPDQATLTKLSMFKGWGYVLVTALLLYWLIRRHTAALYASAAQPHLVIDAIPALIAYVDADKRYRFNNYAYEAWFGHSPLEIQGQRVDEFLGAAAYAAVSKYVETALAGQRITFESWVPFREGGERFIQSTYIPDVGADGHVKGFFALVNDLTERKRAEAQIQALAKFPAENPYPVLRASREGILLYANPASADLLRSWHCAEGESLSPAWLDSIQACLDANLPREEVSAGGERIFSLTLAPVKEGDYVNLYGLDITERQRVEEALRESEDKFKYVFDHSVIGKSITLPSGEISVNKAFCDMLGYTQEELQSQKWPDITHPGDIELTQKAIDSLLSGEKESLRFNKRYIHKNGSVVWTDASTSLRRDKAGQPLYFVTAISDITERKQAEEALAAERALLRTIVDILPALVYAKDTACRKILANHVDLEYMGASTEAEALGTTDFDFYPQDMAARFYARDQGIIQTGKPLIDYEHSIIKADGQQRWLLTSKVPLRDSAGQVIGLVGVGLDITERKQAEEEIRASEERYRGLFENMIEGYAYCQMIFEDGEAQDWVYLAVNDAFETLTGLKDVTGKRVSTVIPGIRETDAGLLDIYARVSLTGQPEKFEIFVQALKMWFSVSVYSPEKEYFVAVFDVITARKQAEEEIRQLNAELEQRVLERTAELNDLYNRAPCGYHSLDRDGVFVRINDTELDWLGYTREEVVGKMKAPDLFTPASVETFQKNFPVFKERGWLENLELDMVRKDGSILFVLLNATVVTDQNGRYLLSRSTMIDYTARKRAEMALQQSQAKLEAANKELEAFSYSVSHDLRAPLRGIDGWSLALLEDYYDQLDAPARQYLDRVRSEAQRMGQLIDALLQLSRVSRAEMQKSLVNLTTLAQTIVTRLQATQPEHQVEAVIQPGLTAQGDATLLEIVLTNLLGNAWKFSGARQPARIEFGRLPTLSSPTEEDKEKVVYFVRDNGVGFDMAYAKKLFGAFQRMHKASQFPGTGIGLATVQRIIHRHGGRVWAEAQVDRGATFYFTLEE